MKKIKKYSTILSQLLLDFEEKHKKSASGYTTIAIIDTQRHHYQALIYGFQAETHAYDCSILFHFDIIDDKVWFQCNYTDLLIEDELLKLGIPKSDIVFGWLPEYAREHSGWGVGEKAA